MSNPNTDPHEYEASASVAELVGKAELIVQNGGGLRHLHEQDRVRQPAPGP
jgi:ABC-type Zn uptake system ZnuABC Zn-binding protein ZnuA